MSKRQTRAMIVSVLMVSVKDCNKGDKKNTPALSHSSIEALPLLFSTRSQQGALPDAPVESSTQNVPSHPTQQKSWQDHFWQRRHQECCTRYEDDGADDSHEGEVDLVLVEEERCRQGNAHCAYLLHDCFRSPHYSPVVPVFHISIQHHFIQESVWGIVVRKGLIFVQDFLPFSHLPLMHDATR